MPNDKPSRSRWKQLLKWSGLVALGLPAAYADAVLAAYMPQSELYVELLAAFEVRPDGSLANQREFVKLPSVRMDMCR